MRLPPHLDTLTTQESSLDKERGVHLEDNKRSILVLWSYTVLGWILYRGSFVGFSFPQGFPRINLCVFFSCYACHSFSDFLIIGHKTFKNITIDTGKLLRFQHLSNSKAACLTCLPC